MHRSSLECDGGGQWPECLIRRPASRTACVHCSTHGRAGQRFSVFPAAGPGMRSWTRAPGATCPGEVVGFRRPASGCIVEADSRLMDCRCEDFDCLAASTSQAALKTTKSMCRSCAAERCVAVRDAEIQKGVAAAGRIVPPNGHLCHKFRSFHERVACQIRCGTQRNESQPLTNLVACTDPIATPRPAPVRPARAPPRRTPRACARPPR